MTYEQYQKELESFTRYAKSVEVTQPEVLENQLIVQNDFNINLGILQDYYQAIIDNNLNQALSLHDLPPSIDDFEQLYGNIYKVTLSDIKEINSDSVQLIMESQKHNSGSNLYRVTTVLSGDKIVNEKVEKIIGDYVLEDNLFISGLNVEGLNYLVMSEDGSDIIVDEAPYDPEEQGPDPLNFSNPQIVENGKYLLYQEQAYNHSGNSYYDLESQRKLFTSVWPIDNGFTSDGNYFYSCRNNMPPVARIGIVIRKGPEFEVIAQSDKESILNSYNRASCSYNPDEEALYITLSEPVEESSGLDNEQILKYSFPEYKR